MTKIHGLQKTTLLDWPGKVACTVFLGGCDFRCPFCHNSALITGNMPEAISEDEFIRFLSKRKGLLDGVCLTGGEPLLRSDLAEFLNRIKDMGYPIKLDTNGNHPKQLADLCKKGLIDYVAMDIKNCPERYAETVGVAELDLSLIQESVEWLLSGQVEYEFRTTIVRQFHDSESIVQIGQWIHSAKRYYLQGFVNSKEVLASGLEAYSKKEMEQFLRLVRAYLPAAELRGV